MTYTGEQKRKYQRDWIKRRRDAAVQRFGGSCNKCGSTDQLQFDHIDASTKVFKPTNLWSRRAEVVEVELLKCQLLCFDCHLKKSQEYLDGYRTSKLHGNSKGYDYGKCRCRECRDWNRDRARVQRANRLTRTA